MNRWPMRPMPSVVERRARERRSGMKRRWDRKRNPKLSRGKTPSNAERNRTPRAEARAFGLEQPSHRDRVLESREGRRRAAEHEVEEVTYLELVCRGAGELHSARQASPGHEELRYPTELEIRDALLELGHVAHAERDARLVEPPALGDDRAWKPVVVIQGGDMALGAGAQHLSQLAEAPADEVGVMKVKVEQGVAASRRIEIEIAPVRWRAGPGERQRAERPELLPRDLIAKPRPARPESHAERRHHDAVRSAPGGLEGPN